MREFDISFHCNYVICERIKDKDNKDLSIPLHVKSHSFIYHVQNESLEQLADKLIANLSNMEEQWIQNSLPNQDSTQSVAQIAEENSEQLLVESTQNQNQEQQL